MNLAPLTCKWKQTEIKRLDEIKYAGKGGNMTKRIGLMGAAAVLMLGLVACGPTSPSSGGNAATARAATLYAILTESSHNQNNPSPTAAAINTATPGIPSITPTLVATAIPLATELPSVTPTSAQLPTPCYRAFLVQDVTIPDYYNELTPGQTFMKTWRLRNTGSCDWAVNTEIIFSSGSQMGGPSALEIGQVVKVGDSIDISITLQAPTKSGTHTGFWMLRTPGGSRFGVGDGGDQSIYVLIVISGNTSTPTVTYTPGTPTATNIPRTPTTTKTPTITPSPTPLPTWTGTRTPSLTPTCVGGYPVC
jgi:hypothetical protein